MRSIAHADQDVETTTRWLRRDLRGLALLELAQRGIAIGALVAIAVGAVLQSQDAGLRTLIATALVLSMAYLTLAFRTRRGAELVQRDLWLLEARHASERAGTERPRADVDAHPYRSTPAPPGMSRARPREKRPRPRLRLAIYGCAAALAGGAALASLAWGSYLGGVVAEVQSGIVQRGVPSAAEAPH